MLGLRKMMTEELAHLISLQQELTVKKYNIPEGTLRISSLENKYPRYYIRNAEGKYEYIKSKNTMLAQQLAQKEYEQKVWKSLCRRISQLQRILKDYSDTEIEDIYINLHENRKILINPIEEIWEEKQKKWQSEEYEGKEFQLDTPMILTEKGERVRSKSEKILADYFFHKGIPYKYEKPLYLKGVGMVYPDFTLLSTKTQREIYWEHDGRMDDSVYANNAVKKINAYIKNGILPGDRLILTYETSNYPLQMDCVEHLIKRYF